MNRDQAKADLLPKPLDTHVPAIAYKIERKQSTGTAEAATISKALKTIHETLESFVETIQRTDEKESLIAARLVELKETIENNLTEDELKNIENILEDLDGRIFEESTFTEKCGRGAMRMTTATKLTHLDKIATSAARIAQIKQKMSDGEYTPTAVVVEKGNATIELMQKTLYDALPRKQAETIMDDVMTKLVKIWD